jgi:riboflavin kinase / FMN adenylyltransferase
MIAEVIGTVAHGKRIGRTLGFPTANVVPDFPEALPQDGVYVALMRADGMDGEWLALVSQGFHPTLPEGGHTVEAYALGFDGNLYGRRVSLRYMKYLRGELFFPSVDAMVRQMELDRAEALAWQAEQETR